jgi:transcriptional regulator with XRE-family HTH domain
MAEVRRVPSRPRTPSFSKQAALFARKIRAARTDLGWSQLRLSEESGVSYRQIQLIESNSNNEKGSDAAPQPANPKLDTVYLLAQALQVTVSYLVDPDRDVDPVDGSA